MVFSNPSMRTSFRGYRCFAISPVMVSSSTIVQLFTLLDMSAGMAPTKLPTPLDGSNMRPPLKPSFWSPLYMARITGMLV